MVGLDTRNAQGLPFSWTRRGSRRGWYDGHDRCHCIEHGTDWYMSVEWVRKIYGRACLRSLAR